MVMVMVIAMKEGAEGSKGCDSGSGDEVVATCMADVRQGVVFCIEDDMRMRSVGRGIGGCECGGEVVG